MKYTEYQAFQFRLTSRHAAEDLSRFINEKLAEGWHFICFAPADRPDTPTVLFGKVE